MSLTSEESRRVLSALLEALSTSPSIFKRLATATGCEPEQVIDALAGRIEELPASADAQRLRTLTKVLDRLRMAETSVREYAALAPSDAAHQGTLLMLLRELREETERLWRAHQRALIKRLNVEEADEDGDGESEEGNP